MYVTVFVTRCINDMSLVNAERREGTYENGQGTFKYKQATGALGEAIRSVWSLPASVGIY